ncbi:MAG: MoxR family ATPase [Myxococcales bacterium]|nr:MoxR family ATPase [Myxococcales bacterium]
MPGPGDFDIYRGDGQFRPEAHRQLPETPALFEERGAYLPDRDLVEAVNIALCVGRPLLLTGEPGCGKTRLAWSLATELGLDAPLQFFTRSTSRAQDLLYTFDAVQRFHDIQMKSARADDPHNYVQFEALGRAIVEGKRRVVLIDEIDKAPRDFPNDLLNEIDRMSFEVRELTGDDRVRSAKVRPIVVITSNSERQLPLPFLRRCVFHYIGFPERDKLIRIVEERLSGDSLDGDLIKAAVDKFLAVRKIKGLTKKPATGELLTWVHALQVRGVAALALRESPQAAVPLWQALLKDRDDLRRLQEAT